MADGSKRAPQGRARRVGHLVTALSMMAVLAIGLAACGGDPNSERDREHCSAGAACAVPQTTALLAAPSVDIAFRPVLRTTVPMGSSPVDTVGGATGAEVGAPCPTEPVTIPSDTTAGVVECTNGVVVGTDTLGPVALTGSAIASARATRNNQTGEWVLNPVFKAGADGIDGFNAVAAHCYAKDVPCPTGQLAVVVNGRVIMAPTIQSTSFEADQIQISANFTEESATALAADINAAA